MHIIIKYNRGGGAALLAKKAASSSSPSSAPTSPSKTKDQKEAGDEEEEADESVSAAVDDNNGNKNRFSSVAAKNAVLRLAVLNFKKRYSMGPAASNKFQEKISIGMNNDAIYKRVSFAGAVTALKASNKMLKILRSKQHQSSSSHLYSPKSGGAFERDESAIHVDTDDSEDGGVTKQNNPPPPPPAAVKDPTEVFANDRSHPLAMVVALLSLLSARTGIPYEEINMFQSAVHEQYLLLNQQHGITSNGGGGGGAAANKSTAGGGKNKNGPTLDVELLKLSSPSGPQQNNNYNRYSEGGGLKTFNDLKEVPYERRLEIALKQPMLTINQNKNFSMMVRHQCNPSSSAAENNATINGGGLIPSSPLSPKGGGRGASTDVRANDLGRLLHMWYEADSDCSGNITEAELKTLLERINISVSVMTAEKLLSFNNNNGNDGGGASSPSKKKGSSKNEPSASGGTSSGSHQQIIDFKQFFGIYRRLTTVRDIKALFLKYATPLDKLELVEIEDREVSNNSGGDEAAGVVDGGNGTKNSNILRVSVQRRTAAREVSAASMRNLSQENSNAAADLKIFDAADEKMKQLINQDPENEEYYCLLRDDCRNFLIHEQLESEEDAETLLPSFGFTGDIEGINLRQFQQTLLNCCQNSWVHPRELSIHHEMSHPMTHYFINSSHNTYLCGHQLTGKSSTDMYALSLLNGNRCVELDCYDGADNTPEVTHGNTLTTRIKFRDVCQTINDCGFVTSPYPITLSLEVHTSIAQQEEMVRIMAEIFGPKLTDYGLAYSTTLSSPLFTPEGLRGKIIVKSKRKKDKGKTKDGKLDGHNAAGNNNDSDNDEHQQPQQQKDDGLLTNLASISEKLSDQTFMPAVKFKSLEALSALPHYGVSSVDEAKVEGWYRDLKQQQLAVNVAKGFMVRVYPSGTRMDSSNLDPQISWNIGAQMSAMNIQTQDRGNRLNFYKFRYSNNNCGYLLKPKSQRMEDKVANNNTYNDDLILSVTVMFGFSLPRPDHLKSGDIADPFVELFVRGFGNDDSLTSNSISATGQGGGGETAKTNGNAMANMIKAESNISGGNFNSTTIDGDDEQKTDNNKEREGGRNNAAATNGSLLRHVSDPELFKRYKNQVHTTRTIDDNGFKPSWSSDERDDKNIKNQRAHAKLNPNAIDHRGELHSRLRNRREGETFCFAIRAVELATLCIRVLDRDVVGAGLMGETAIPLASIREGYRQVPLFDKEGREIPSPASLFLRIQWENPMFIEKELSKRQQREGGGTSPTTASFRFLHAITTGPKDGAPLDKEQGKRRDFNATLLLNHHQQQRLQQYQQQISSNGISPASSPNRHVDATDLGTAENYPAVYISPSTTVSPLSPNNNRHRNNSSSDERGVSVASSSPALMLQSASPQRLHDGSGGGISFEGARGSGIEIIGGATVTSSSALSPNSRYHPSASPRPAKAVQFQNNHATSSSPSVVTGKNRHSGGIVILDDDNVEEDEMSDDRGMIDPALL